jgi:hypothetical protein
MDVEKVLGRVFSDTEQVYNFKDSILYALGVGIGSGPESLRFCAVVPARDNVVVLDRCTAEIG